MSTPEFLARQQIDLLLSASGWIIQDRLGMNLYAARGVAIREFPLETGFADYLLFVDRKAVGVVEAKKVGTTLSGVAEQAGSYAAGLPQNVPHVGMDKLPFVYESTGVETFFRDERDPEPRSRQVFSFHRPETLAEWCDDTVGATRWVAQTAPLRYVDSCARCLRRTPSTRPDYGEHRWRPSPIWSSPSQPTNRAP